MSTVTTPGSFPQLNVHQIETFTFMSPDGVTPHENSQDLPSSPYESMTSPFKEAEVDTDVLIDLTPEPRQTAPLPVPLQARPRPTPKKSQSG